ncbi:AraC family transcriptional regulator [Rubellicoccus peritrichatus]|uniref:AraC family transcriptional regulator n=1 Tax=Rubellicoccus peritrichatus TaxID=3080537 RepID=A0AAQ3LAW9_9BACT|nr:AraC family transcriptional regulator [Puniceicoccus sp. CR14]WOO40882.1 AraC family transcriptional regulator [Puniceicoccus sp. CR14]
MSLSDLHARVALRSNGAPGIYHCDRDWSWSPPPLPDYDFWLVLKGEGELRVNERAYSIHAGSCFILTPGTRVEGIQNPEKQLSVFFMHFDLLDQESGMAYAKSWNVPPPATTVYDLQLLQALCRYVIAQYEVINERGRFGFELAVWQLLQVIDDATHRQSYTHHDERIRKVIELIEQEYHRDWSVESMAAIAGMSRTHFTRRFKAETGSAPNAYLVHKRVSQATSLIRESGMTISQIAYGLGYSDVAFFNRQFKAVTGVTPGSLRHQS